MVNSIVKSASWLSAARLTVRLLGVVSLLVLARLLTPEDFGLIAIVAGVVGLLDESTNLGLNQALIHYRNADPQDYHTAWTLSVARGILVGFALFASSYPLSIFFDDPRYFSIFMVVSALPIIKGLQNVNFIIYEKKLDFSVLFKIMVLTKILGVITTISLAFIWKSYWVLIAGMLVTATTNTILTYVYAPFQFALSLKSWRKLLNFSGWLWGAELIGSINNRVDPLIYNFIFSPSFVGIIYVSKEISGMLNEVAAPLRRVMFPALSNIGLGTNSFNLTYSKGVSGLFMFMAPVCLGLIMLSPRLVPLILGEQWYEAIEFIQVFSLVISITILGGVAQSALMAAGNTKFFFYRSLLFLPIRLGLIISLGLLYGKYGVMVGIGLSGCILTLINIAMVKRVTAIGFRQHCLLVARFVIPLVAMASAVQWVLYRFDAVFENQLFEFIFLLGVSFIGALVYVGFVWLIWTLKGMPDGPEKIIFAGVKSIVSKANSNE